MKAWKKDLLIISAVLSACTLGATAFSALLTYIHDHTYTAEQSRQRHLETLPCHDGSPTSAGCPHVSHRISFKRDGSPVCECPIVWGER